MKDPVCLLLQVSYVEGGWRMFFEDTSCEVSDSRRLSFARALYRLGIRLAAYLLRRMGCLEPVTILLKNASHCPIGRGNEALDFNLSFYHECQGGSLHTA